MVGYILKVKGIFIGLINLLILLDNIKLPNRACDKYFVLQFASNQYEAYLSVK